MPDHPPCRTDTLAEAYEGACRAGQIPNIDEYLAGADPDARPVLLRELVGLELEYSLRAGQTIRVEGCLSRHPELGADRSTVLGLIVLEFRVRRACAQAVTVAEYLDRFPALRAELAAALAGALTIAPGADTTSSIPGAPSGRVDFLAPPQQPDEIGRLGVYRVLGELGRGGMGVVFRAEDPQLKRLVALKVLLPALSADPRAKARFVREAQAQAKVEHDHVTPIFHIGEADGLAILVMPLLKGQTLAAALRQNPRPPVSAVVRIGREVAAGLAAAHAVALIHRDIKPGNIWLDGNQRRVKILDFGLARSAERTAKADADGTDGPATASGAVMGTPAYMSPEQARGQPVDARTDLFSLGVVLYEMTTGRRPFVGATTFDLMTAVVSERPPAVADLVPDVPPALSDLIGRLLAKDAAGRPESAEAVAAELGAIERGLAGLPVQVFALGAVPGAPNPWADLDTTQVDEAAPAPVAKPEPRHTSVRWRWPAAGLVGAVAVAALVWLAVQSLKPKPTPTDEPVAELPKQPKPKDAPFVPRPDPTFFNGKDLTGWIGAENHWRVDNGEIVGAFPPGAVRTETFLRSKREFADFELSFQVRLLSRKDPSSKSPHCGLMLRGASHPSVAHQVTRGPKCIFGGSQWGCLNGAPNAGTTTSALEARRSVKADDFNDVTVRCIGQQFKVTVNGAVAVDVERPNARPNGLIAWSLGEDCEELRIRNVRLIYLSKPPSKPDYALRSEPPGECVVTVPSLTLPLTGPVTLEGYFIKSPQATGHRVPIRWPYQLWIDQAGASGRWELTLAGALKNYGILDATVRKDDESTHLAGVFDDEQARLFVNGRLVGVVKFSAENPFKRETKEGLNIFQEFTGVADEIRVSKVARYHTDFTPDKRFEPDADTIALYHCDEGQGEVLTDSSGNGHHGKIMRPSGYGASLLRPDPRRRRERGCCSPRRK